MFVCIFFFWKKFFQNRLVGPEQLKKSNNQTNDELVVWLICGRKFVFGISHSSNANGLKRPFVDVHHVRRQNNAFWQLANIATVTPLYFRFFTQTVNSALHRKRAKKRNLCVKYSPSASIRFSLYCSFVLFLFTEISSINCNYRIFNKRACISYLIFSFIFIF